MQQGLSLDGARWALGSRVDSNWLPLTWLSHMLDVELFGAWAGGHHATNLVLHALATALLFALLLSATRELVPSALVAALFALHPLHVEVVAWVSQRKELLSDRIRVARRAGLRRAGCSAAVRCAMRAR